MGSARKIIPDSAIPYLKNAYRGVGKRQVMDRRACLLSALMDIKKVGVGGEILASCLAQRVKDGGNIKTIASSLLECVPIGRTPEEITKWRLP